jgi:hypothetical protein
MPLGEPGLWRQVKVFDTLAECEREKPRFIQVMKDTTLPKISQAGKTFRIERFEATRCNPIGAVR